MLDIAWALRITLLAGLASVSIVDDSAAHPVRTDARASLDVYVMNMHSILRSSKIFSEGDTRE
jgi:hypothetical protein